MNYVAIGNNELGAKLGKMIECPHCGKSHLVEHSGPSKRYNHDGIVTEGPAGVMQFYSCGGKTYMCGIDGRIVKRWQA